MEAAVDILVSIHVSEPVEARRGLSNACSGSLAIRTRKIPFDSDEGPVDVQTKPGVAIMMKRSKNKVHPTIERAQTV